MRNSHLIEKQYQLVQVPISIHELLEASVLVVGCDEYIASKIFIIEAIEDFQLDTKSLSRDICLYLLSITKETVTHTNEIHQDFWQFYMF